MNIREIEYLSACFRYGIEVAHEDRLFRERPFSDFPNACCGDAPDLLAQYLMDNIQNYVISCRCVYGTYRYDDFENIYGHSWLVVNDKIIVDITADQRQFKNEEIFPQDAVIPCYVGEKSKLHSLFEIEPSQCRNFYGLQNLGECSYKRMKKLYDTILKCINKDTQ